MLFIFFVTLFFLLTNTYSELVTPRCSTCKWFIPGKFVDLGQCVMFREKIGSKTINNFAIHSRNNENMCGKNGIFYEQDLTESSTYTNFFSPEEKKFYLYYMNKIAKKNL